MPNVMRAVVDALRGSVRLYAEGVPSGHVRVTRTEKRTPELIRGGEFDVSTGGFIREDAEAPFGTELTYRASVEPTVRHIQSNRVLNPKAKTSTANWTAGTGRTLDREDSAEMVPPRDAVTSLKIGPNAAGTSAGGVPERTLVSTVPNGFGPGRWMVTGQLHYDSPDLWLWEDVKTRTWQQVRDVGTWQQVKSKSSETAVAPFATLWAAVLSPTDTVVVEPSQVLGVQAIGGSQWHTFSAWVDVPVGVPAGSRLVFLQGALTREYTVTWWLTTVMVTPEAEVTDGALMPYFDGDTPVPANPASNLKPGYDWVATTSDSSIVWNGTDNSSVSVFTGPSAMHAEARATISIPGQGVLPKIKQPVFLSDPVTPQLSLWFELLAIGPLSRRARAELFDVLNRGAQVAVSQKRAWASGEFRLLTRTPEEEAIADRLFDSGRILYYRNPDPRYPETSWYLHIGDVSWSRVGDQYGAMPERVWSVPFVRVERPEGLITASNAIDWAYLKAHYTWGELRTMREDWLDAALTAADA